MDPDFSPSDVREKSCAVEKSSSNDLFPFKQGVMYKYQFRIISTLIWHIVKSLSY